jgi:hypothetical protein
LAVQEAAGATQEQTQAIRDQIAALQAQQEVYTAEHRVMQDRATLADQSLPTEREMKNIYKDMVGYIRTYSGQTQALIPLVDLQTAATKTLKDVTGGATDYLGFFTRGLGDSAGRVIDMNYDQVTAGRHVIDVFNSISAPSGYQMGTPYVPSTGIYQLHRGEAVIPAGAVVRSGASGGSTRPTVINNYGRVTNNWRDDDAGRQAARELERLFRYSGGY